MKSRLRRNSGLALILTLALTALVRESFAISIDTDAANDGAIPVAPSPAPSPASTAIIPAPASISSPIAVTTAAPDAPSPAVPDNLPPLPANPPTAGKAADKETSAGKASGGTLRPFDLASVRKSNAGEISTFQKDTFGLPMTVNVAKQAADESLMMKPVLIEDIVSQLHIDMAMPPTDAVISGAVVSQSDGFRVKFRDETYDIHVLSINDDGITLGWDRGPERAILRPPAQSTQVFSDDDSQSANPFANEATINLNPPPQGQNSGHGQPNDKR